ncbi:MAG TPA: acyltransferase, partial [Bacteroidia bacterium]
EKENYRTISLKKFYLRRIFRIWPLYFLVLILGFFILPHIHIIDLPYYKKHFEEHYFINLILYLLIIPNLAFSIFPSVPHIGQSWSIGVEEQFYIFWPLMIKRSVNIGKLIINAFCIYILIKVSVLILHKYLPHINWLLYLKNFISMCKFESMLIGAYGAWILFNNKQKMLAVIYHPITFYTSLLSFPVINYFVYKGILQDGIHVIISVQFIIVILNIATNPNCSIKLKSKLLDYLGKISYGLYMYHLMIIPFIVYLFKTYMSYSGGGLVQNIMIYVFSILVTIVISGLSYTYFENYFLKIKSRFEVH